MRHAVLLWLALTTMAGAQTLTEDFGKAPAGPVLDLPGWEVSSIGWEIANGALVGDSGLMPWLTPPFGQAVTFACDVTPLEVLKGDWRTCGIALVYDDRNFWATQFVVSPEADGARRFTELQESLHGTWLAQGQEGTRLPATPGRVDRGSWEMGTTYRMTLTLTAESILAEIRQGETVLAHYGHELTPGVDAVRAGRPALRANGLRARFDNLSVTVTAPATEPAAAAVAAPPAWESRPGQAIAPAAGFFRPVEVDGRWWVVDPEGKPFFIVGTDHIRYGGHWCEKLGYAPYGRNMKEMFPNEADWAADTAQRLKDWGFNMLPAGHSPSMRGRGMPYILFASFGSSFARREWLCEPINWTGFPDVFSPFWEQHCRLVAERLVQGSRRDPWLFGSFLDNELEWYGKKGSLVDEVFQRGPEVAGKQALYSWLVDKYHGLANVNRALGTNYADRKDFLATTTVPKPSDALDEVRDGFLEVIAERYFGGASRALKAADPEHLNLGCRFAGRTPEAVLATAGKYCDIFTINTYPRVEFLDRWTEDLGGTVIGTPQQLHDYYAVVKRPMIITEWSFPALDSGLPCQHGAGMRVDTQEQKAACYRIFANMIADQPFMVGYHYFMWVDEPELGISSTFPEDSNYGLVNVRNEPYTTLVETATEVNQNAAARHARSRYSGKLELSPADGGVTVRNPDRLASYGALWIGSAAGRDIVPVELAPGASQFYPAPGQGHWHAELQLWDGTKQRVVGGPPVPAGHVANGSATALTNVPVILDTVPPRAAFLNELAPGAMVAVPPAGGAERITALELPTERVTWKLAQTDGSLFDSITAGDLALGKLFFAVHQRVDGHDQWVSTDAVESFDSRAFADGWVIDAVLAKRGEGGAITAVDAAGEQAAVPTGPATYRAGVRAVVYKQDGLALVRPLWVESTDARLWEIADLFIFCRSAIGGDMADDEVGGPDVPNYYLSGQFWSDTKLGGVFGAASSAGAWTVRFWTDPGGGRHPDAYYGVAQRLAKGQRYVADEVPYLWIFAGRDAGVWRSVAMRQRQVSRALLAGQ